MKQKNNHGIPLKGMGMEDSETHEVHFTTLSEAQTAALLREVKKVVGSDSNITHLGHAAMILALLRFNPLLSTITKAAPFPLYSPCWLNGRRYLFPLFPAASVNTNIPLCMAFAPIIFPDLRDLSLSLEAGREEVKAKLVKACQTATEEYMKIKNRKSILPQCVVLFENLGRIKYVVHIRVPIISTPKRIMIAIKLKILTIGRKPQDLMPTKEDEPSHTEPAEPAQQDNPPRSEVKADIKQKPEGKQGTPPKSDGTSPSSKNEQDFSPKPGSERNSSPKSDFEQITPETRDPVGPASSLLKEISQNHSSNDR